MSNVADALFELDRMRKDEGLNGSKLIHENLMGGVYEIHPLLGEGYRYEGIDVTHSQWGSGVPFVLLASYGFNDNWNWLMKALAKLKHKYPDTPTWAWGEEVYNNVFNSVLTDFSPHMTFLFLVDFLQQEEKSK